MPFIKLYVHAVWATRDRLPYLKETIRANIFDHIHDYAKSKDIIIDQLNGVQNHVHCLISMKADQNIANIMQLIKGESSHWINKQSFIREKFAWQDEYFAVSIGESQVSIIRAYIRGQEAHHQKRTFQEEYDEFMRNYGFVGFMG